MPTVSSLKIQETPNFDSEWVSLVSIVKTFGEKGPEIIAEKEHPFFGELTDEEWAGCNTNALTTI